MGRYICGDHNVLCDRCGFKFKRSEMQFTWDGLLVCREDWDPKQPQLTLKPRADRQAVRDARPRQGTVTNDQPPISATNTEDLV